MRIQTTVTIVVIGDNGREIARTQGKSRSAHFEVDQEPGRRLQHLNKALSLAKKRASDPASTVLAGLSES